MKIGVFDSGRGGVFVTERLQKLNPNDEFIIVNDHKNVPYGDKTREEIVKLTEMAIKPLLRETKIIIIACNTATAYAITYLRAKFPNHKFIGFEPMIKPAVLATETGKIAVLATPATLKSSRYLELKTEWAGNFEVFEPNCETWAKKIENNEFIEKDLIELVELVQRNNIDQVILACTHYLGVEKVLQENLPETVQILQPIMAINKRLNELK